MRSTVCKASLTLLFLSASAYAGGVPSKFQGAFQSTDRLIIKYKDSHLLNPLNLDQLQKKMSSVSPAMATVKMQMVRNSALNANIVQVTKQGKALPLIELKQLTDTLMEDPSVEYAEPDYRMYPKIVPNDTVYNAVENFHWHLKSPTASNKGGANLEGAWDVTTGSTGDVIAVIDTGILDHTELDSKILTGYDFITDTTTANDSDGRDGDPSDPGDWCTASDIINGYCGQISDSSWHGTHVSGTIAAESNDNSGMTGINWNGKILPIRVLGKGGGYTSDIADGMMWAAGIAVSGVPNNANPAKVLNMSLGGTATCPSTYQAAIDAVNATGAIIVVAAGNENQNAANATPANCSGVITVAAASQTGSRAYYSNYGSKVDIAAPGGDYNDDTMIYSTLDGGTTTPNNDNDYAHYQGTSMATPHIAGIASLITSSGILPAASSGKVNYILQETARTFPTGTGDDCTTALCGAGLVDAAAALAFANDPGSDYSSRYSDDILDKQVTTYDFSSASDKVDATSSWYISNGRLYSNDIGDNETTSYTLMFSGNGYYDIYFEFGVNSQLGSDPLLFYIEDSFAGGWWGSYSSGLGLQDLEINDGGIKFEWIYFKDGAGSSGTDDAWIDNVTVTAYTGGGNTSFSDGPGTKRVQIFNEGADPLTISNVALSNMTNFSFVNGCTGSLDFQESCFITVNYTGPGTDPEKTTLSYTTSDASQPSVSKQFDNGSFAPFIPVIDFILN